MNELFKEYLFDKHILVGKDINENGIECVFSLARIFNIRIKKGVEMADLDMVRLASEKIGRKVPDPFYTGFPKSVLTLSANELIFDQWVSYVRTYGFGNFEETVHSIMENPVARQAFDEKVSIRDFEIVSEEEAVQRLDDDVNNMLSGTRALSESDYKVLFSYVKEYEKKISRIASKNTAVKLLCDLRDMDLTKFLQLSDVYKLVDEMNYSIYERNHNNKLNFKNSDRKFVTKVIRRLIADGKCDLNTCYEKKKFWCGLLHHIHFEAQTEAEKSFADCMRNKGNHSVYSSFEEKITQKDVAEAAEVIKNGKGEGALLRNLTYLLSRCETKEEAIKILDKVDGTNGIILLQLLQRFSFETNKDAVRQFAFTRHNMTKVHTESVDEAQKRKSFVKKEYSEILSKTIEERLEKLYANRLKTVYIDEDMKNAALPISESSSQKGFETLSKGSRIHISNLKKIRAFTYWEKADDIDLSVMGLGLNGQKREFSWRTMANEQSPAMVYSGDVTSGYNGGCEYFDIDIEKVKIQYPELEYLVLCDNVYSRICFSKLVCRAGYMLRDIEDSGEIFEPSTVKSSFAITANSTFAYLYAIDLKKDDFVWINIAKQSTATIAGTQSFDFLLPILQMTKIMNVHKFASILASEITTNPSEADVVFSDKEENIKEGAEQIKSFETARLINLLETGK